MTHHLATERSAAPHDVATELGAHSRKSQRAAEPTNVPHENATETAVVPHDPATQLGEQPQTGEYAAEARTIPHETATKAVGEPHGVVTVCGLELETRHRALEHAADPRAVPHEDAAERGVAPHQVATFPREDATGSRIEPHEDAPEVASLPLRNQLVEELSERYLAATKTGKRRILDEFVARTGYHRKHAVRLLRHGVAGPRSPYFDDEVREALVLVWETAGRVGSRRLKVLIPKLVPDMVRQGQLPKDLVIRGKLLAASAATIDRLLAPVRTRSRLSLLENQLETMSAATAAMANFTIPADLSPEERRHLEAEYSKAMEDLRRLLPLDDSTTNPTDKRG